MCLKMEVSPYYALENSDIEEARIISWFSTGLHNEFIRLLKKNKQLQSHEMLLLNNSVSNNANGEEMNFINFVTNNSDMQTEISEKLFFKNKMHFKERYQCA